MSRRILAAILLCLAVASPALAVDSSDPPTPWWFRGLALWAPFDDPASPLKLIRGTGALTFTRAHDATHTATYVHPGTGLVTVADNNALRIESNGALIEGQRTNLLLLSRAFDNVDSWAITATLAKDEVGIDGVAASAYTASSDSGVNKSFYQAFVISADTADYVLSFYIKKDAVTSRYPAIELEIKVGGVTQDTLAYLNTQTGSVAVQNLAGTVGTAGAVSVGDFWRFWLRLANSNNTTMKAFFYPAGSENGTTYSLTVPGSCIVDGGQLEKGSFLSSFVPTTATAVTRNKDDLTLPTSGNLDNTTGTLALNWTPEWGSTVAVGSPVLFDAGGIKAYYNSTDDKLYFTDGTNTISTAALTFSAGDTMKLAFRWSASGLDIYKDGAEAATGATYTAPSLNANLYIGSDVSNANQAFSNFKDPMGWNRAFTGTELQIISR